MKYGAISKGGSVAIIGAGIIGVTSAIELCTRGYSVFVFDPYPPGEGGSSKGNAGHIGASNIEPLSSPGIALAGLKFLMQRHGPLKIPGIEKIRLLPWFLEFLKTSRPDRYLRAITAITYLSQRTIEDMEVLLASAGMADKMVVNGAGYIYDSKRTFSASQDLWSFKAEAGFDSRIMSTYEIRSELPNLNPKFHYGINSNKWAKVSDPLEIVQGLAQYARTIGVAFQEEAVTGIDAISSGVTLHTKSKSKLFDGVVVAAGVHSKAFATSMGERLPLVAERGYNVTYPQAGLDVDLPLIFPDRGLAVTQVNNGLRIGGWAEYSSPSRKATLSYFEALKYISVELFPQLNVSGAVLWMGQRPSLPDSVPVISNSQSSQRVFFNCGHGHCGLTHSATSAFILGEILASGLTLDAYRAYSISRFSNP